jgi:hypothetical protein
LKEYVQQVLAEHNRAVEIRDALYFGSDAVKAQPDNGWWRRKSTRRHQFWENAVARLIELTADDPGVQVVRHHDTVSFIYDDAVLVRLKKADYTLHSSNYPTAQAELFHAHRADLFGHPGLQRVEAVYVPNRFDTDVLWTGIVARDGHAPLWHFELVDAPAPAVLPIPAPARPAPAPAALAKLKKQTEEKKTGESDDK